MNHRTTDQNSLSFHPALTLAELVRATQLCLGLLRTVIFSKYSWAEYLGTFRSAPVHSSPPVQSWTVHRSFFCQVPGTPLGPGRAVSDLKAVGLSCVMRASRPNRVCCILSFSGACWRRLGPRVGRMNCLIDALIWVRGLDHVQNVQEWIGLGARFF